MSPKPPAHKRSLNRPAPARPNPQLSPAAGFANISPARAAAFEILTLIETTHAHSDDLLHSARVDALTPEDRNLTTAMVMGVLRWQIALDARISALLARPDQQLAAPVLLSLRLGAFQLLHLDRIPAHAALNESVELCRAAGHPHASGMVNAILRKLSTEREPGRKLFELPAAFAERLAHPRWLVERWASTYGRQSALAICEYDQHEPPAPSFFVPEPATELPQIDDGSRLIVELAAASLPHTPAPRIWDACAAPGGKTLVLAHRHPTAKILASDISARRLTRMQTRLQPNPAAAHVRFEVLDAGSAQPSGLFDLILCDLPCSGTGTLARNPEIRLHLRPEDLARHAARQRAILTNALRHLAPGGRLLYSTCSLEPEENEQVLAQLTTDIPIRRLPVAPLIHDLAARNVLHQQAATELLRSAIKTETLRTIPGIHSCDGFFAAILERS